MVLVHDGGDSWACYTTLQTLNVSMQTFTFGPRDVRGVATSIPTRDRAGTRSMSPSSLTSEA